MRHYLISCGKFDGEMNIIVVSFCMPVSKDPPMVACAISKNAYSRELIEKCGEFVINVPTKQQDKQVYYCGYHSGRDVDKFSETGFSASPSRKINAPIIEECPAQMECIVLQAIETGDKFLYIAEVVEAYADEALAKGEIELDYSMGEFPARVYGGRFDKK